MHIGGLERVGKHMVLSCLFLALLQENWLFKKENIYIRKLFWKSVALERSKT